MTMTFVVMGLGTVFNALTNRRDPTSGLTAPILQALAISLFPVAMVVLATQLPGLQAGLLTTTLTGLQWLECVGLALLLPLVVEVSKWIRRRRAPEAAAVDAERAVTPGRAVKSQALERKPG
jgi:Ca2+-transporting ATPase